MHDNPQLLQEQRAPLTGTCPELAGASHLYRKKARSDCLLFNIWAELERLKRCCVFLISWSVSAGSKAWPIEKA